MITKQHWTNTQLQLKCILLSLVLIGCSSLTPNGASNSKTNTKLFKLTSVPTTLVNKVWLEKFTIKAIGDLANSPIAQSINQSMLLQTELDSAGINVAAMSFSGLPLAQASWQSQTNTTQTESSLSQSFDAERIIHDLQGVNWPLEVLQTVKNNGISISEEYTDGIRQRQFYRNKKLIMRIRYLAKKINVEQLEQGYHLEVIRLSQTVLTPKPSSQQN